MGLVLLAVRWCLAGIFLRSGLVKVTDLANFRSAVANYKLLPSILENPVAVLLPFAEVVAALFLAIGFMLVVVATGLALLLVIFAVAIAVNLARGRKIECGCAGPVAPQAISWRHVTSDLVLAAAAVSVAVSLPDGPELWLGPTGTAHAVPDDDVFPLLLAVVVCLVMAAVMSRALVVHRLTTDRRFGDHTFSSDRATPGRRELWERHSGPKADDSRNSSSIVNS